MVSYGLFFDVIINIQIIIAVLSCCILIYLTLTTKLTYVKDFSRNLLIGILIDLFMGLVTVFQFYFTLPEALYALIYVFVVAGVFISTALITKGLLKLDEYLYSLIGVNENKNKLKMFIIAILVESIIFTLILIFSAAITSLSDVFLNIVAFGLAVFLYFNAFLCFYLHREIKDLNINAMAYFGVGFLIFATSTPMQIVLSFLNVGLYTVISNVFTILFVVFLMIGYIIFKNKINSFSEKTKK